MKFGRSSTRSKRNVVRAKKAPAPPPNSLAAFAPAAFGLAMAKKKSCWEYSAWEYRPALLPFRIGTKKVPAGTGYRGGNFAVKVEQGQLISVEESDEAKRKRFYEALLELPWLAPRVRVAVMRTLGRSQRDAKVAYGEGMTRALKFRVDEAEARMRANGDRPPRGGFYSAAVEDVADAIGMKSETVERRIRRLRG
jgi:hypothetical protein